MERIVAFLDLLGFKEFMSQDKEGAIRLLWNYETILAVKKIEDNIYPVASYKKELQKLAEKRSASSFEYFLPFSDSIIITSLETTPDLFLKQIGSFILETFLFTGREYKNKEYPTIVETTHIIDKGGGKFDKKIVKEQWFPTLFRGGVAFGDVEILEKCAVISGKAKKSYCVAGSAVIEAVTLEKKDRAPGLVFGESFYQKIDSDDIKNRYVCKENGYYKLLWPALHFIEENKPEGELEKFRDIFIPAVNLWKTYSHLSSADLYFNFLKLIIKSTFSFFKGKIKEEKIDLMINDQIARVGIEYKRFELLNYPCD